MREGRSPLLLMAFADKTDTPEEMARALYEELCAIDPDLAARIEPQDVRRSRGCLSERAPDGWPFGTNKRGEIGFWPLGKAYWPRDSIFHDVPY